MEEFIRVAGTGDVEPGQGIAAEAKGVSVAVFNVGGQFFAIENTCVHRGGPLGEGDLEGDVVSCPWHGWQYSVKTGACLNNPSACVKRFDVLVEGEDVKIKM